MDPTTPAADATRPGALDGWQVLVPGAAEWGRRIAGLLADRGARTVLVPVVEVAPPDDLTCLDSALAALARGDYDWLVVTSPATVLSLSARVATLANRGRQTPSTALGTFVGETAVATLGPGCARVLERSGVTAALVPTGERSSAGLLAAFPEPPVAPPAAGTLGRAGRVLVARSDLASSTVSDGLTARGWQVDDVVAYRTITPDQPGARIRAQARAGEFDAVLLGAPSTVDALVELVGAPAAGTVLGCVGPRTARTATEQGLTVDVVPP
ncbi:uroporphyrinogen-III synthase [Actinotalea sp.]|uniref:uroporphyrinogen-III synthase n=1 Tax=Actinotalea sp. TaxID=1872145 RepID=UPI002B5A5870|nr:uroporphyrinogen-III synthase [Actinotalea sp.]HRA49857.1 uroporphyrinogen-III synthase [Actinotalea sp.]